MKKIQKSIEKLINPGIPLIGQTAGGAIGSIIGFIFSPGVEGAAVGGAGGALVGDLFSRAGQEIEKRYISPRESMRLGATAFFAIDKIRSNLEKGLTIRSDDFFIKNSITDRSDADEILEGTLIAAQKEHEEQKIKFFGYLIGNIAFHKEIGKQEANLLIKIVKDLSFTQLCVLTFIDERSKSNFNGECTFRNTLYILKHGYIYYENDKDDFNFSVFANEFEALSYKQLIGTLGDISTRSTVATDMDLTPLGKKLCKLMELSEIESSQVEKSIRYFVKKRN